MLQENLEVAVFLEENNCSLGFQVVFAYSTEIDELNKHENSEHHPFFNGYDIYYTRDFANTIVRMILSVAVYLFLKMLPCIVSE